MRWRVGLAALVATAVASATAGASLRLARSDLGQGGIKVSVPLPAVQQSSGSTLTFTVTAPPGKTVAPVHVQTANDSALGNLAVIYVVKTPKKPSARETVTVAVLIKRFVSRRLATRKDGASVTVWVTATDDTLHVVSQLNKASQLTCTGLTFYDSSFEDGKTKASTADGDLVVTLVSGRGKREQPSWPEEVLDNIVADIPVPAGCDFKPEGDDPGNS